MSSDGRRRTKGRALSRTDRSAILGVADVLLPFEPRVADKARQEELTARFLLPVLPELHAFFLAVRQHLDRTLEPLQPIKLGKEYPLGQCLEISQAALRQLQLPDQAGIEMSEQALAGYAAFTAFRKAGGILRNVWGDLRGEFFQNAFQLGSLYLDVSNDTVTRTKPKVEILPFEQSRLNPITDFRHFADLSRRYWKNQVFPNHVLPEAAPYCPQVHIAPDGLVSIKDCTEYMVGLTLAGKFAPSEDVLSDAPMPDALLAYVSDALRDMEAHLPATATEGRTLALRACKEYRSKRLYTAGPRAGRMSDMIHEANIRLMEAHRTKPYVTAPKPAPKGPAMKVPEKITVDGREFAYADLPEEARRNSEMVKVIDAKLKDLQRERDILLAARKTYVDALLKSLPTP